MLRAGLDYYDLAKVKRYESYENWLEHHQNSRIFALTTKGSTRYDQAQFQINDVLMFGPETRGLLIAF